MLEIAVLDHIIIAQQSYCSFREQNLL